MAMAAAPKEMDVHSMTWIGIAANAVVSASRQAPTDSSIRKNPSRPFDLPFKGLPLEQIYQALIR